MDIENDSFVHIICAHQGHAKQLKSIKRKIDEAFKDSLEELERGIHY